MTRFECIERNCPLYDEEIQNCAVLAEEGISLDDVESCATCMVRVDEPDPEDWVGTEE